MDSEVLAEAAPLREDVRPPPKAVMLLLPVWGYRYVSQFLEFCLPTLLAPGNVPAVAASLPTRFVVLSRESDEELIRSHPTWMALERACSAEVVFIDDLITDGNHTTTITLAFARAVRQTREAMTDTCFLFLMSDYLFADGALRTVVNHLLGGASGVVAGNFQIIAEEAAPALQDSLSPIFRAIILPARDLAAWSFGYLHPATTANIVNLGLTHNSHVNRLLWRVDENTFIGRFYLIHPIGIRPEVTEFVVGSSLDYSFIPEMCPSGNVVMLTDSDDYFVVEMQPRNHEQANLRAGPIRERDLAIVLSEWTTVQHRANVTKTIIYHAADLPTNLPDMIVEADAYIARVGALLPPTPQPFRNHPYWAGAIASNRLQTGQALSKEDWQFLLGEAIPSAGLRGFVWQVRRALFGSAPDVTRLHTRWPDYNMPRKALQDVLSNGRLLLLTDKPSRFAQWLTGMTSEVFTLEWDRLLDTQGTKGFVHLPEWYHGFLDSFDACLIAATEPMLENVGEVLERIGPLLKKRGQISIMILNDRPYYNAKAFSEMFVRRSAELLSRASWVLEVHYVPATGLRWLVYRASDAVLQRLRAAYQQSLLQLPLMGGALILLGLATYLVNINVRSTTLPPRGLWSSVFLMLRRSREDTNQRFDAAPSWPAFVEHGIQGPQSEWAKNHATAPAAGSESQERESASIGLAHDIAAKLLSGRLDFAVYGFDETDAARITDYNVRKLAVYDARSRSTVESPTSDVARFVQFHDILLGPLPRAHDSICSLNTFTYISRANEEVYFGNLAQSLSRSEDILILGCLSSGLVDRQSPPHDQPWLKLGDLPTASTHGPRHAGLLKAPTKGPVRQRAYPRTGPQLKALAERFFNTVLLFSIADGALHAGAVSSADYILVICCARKV